MEMVKVAKESVPAKILETSVSCRDGISTLVVVYEGFAIEYRKENNRLNPVDIYRKIENK